jgi:tetratricopeptide (TPR) repeat protein
MIVRDEAAHLPACLESIRTVVDEIVIIDTGSTDASIEIARSFEARVHSHPWAGDFATPRNIGLDLARGRWILYIDADERLRPIPARPFRLWLQAAEEIALRVRLRPALDTTPYWEYRLWRSDPRIRFAGKMHEKMTPAIRTVADSDRRPIGDSELFLEHVGYEGDQTHKHRRNLSLLRTQLADEPDNAYNWRHLSAVLAGLGESDEAQAALERAVAMARRHKSPGGALAFAELIGRRRQQGDDVGELLQEAVIRYPDNVALKWEQVVSEVALKRYEEALWRLETFDVDPDMPVEESIGYPLELFGARAAEARGVCLFRLGRYREAAFAYRVAEQLEPGMPAHRLKRVLAEHRSTRDEPHVDSRESPAAGGATHWSSRRLLDGLVIEVGGVTVGLTATDAARARAMGTLLGRLPVSERPGVARLGFGSHRLPIPDRAPDELQGDLRLWHGTDTLSIAYGDSVTAQADQTGAAIGGTSFDLARAFHQAAPFLLARLLGPHRSFVIHAAAIQRGGQAVLVLGGSGTGKSTLILGALQDGWKVLSDDLIVMRAGRDGEPVVEGIPRALVVPGDVIGAEVAVWPGAEDARGRVALRFDSWDRGAHPVGAVAVVGHGEDQAAVVETIEVPELLGMVVNSMLAREPAVVREFGRLAVRLCRLPTFRLRHSLSPSARAPSSAQALAGRLAGV